MKEIKNRYYLILLLLIVILLWGTSAILILTYLEDWNSRGTFGDLFGAVNALFSGLAFAGLLYTINLSKKDLEIQRQEIEINRKELIKSRKSQQHSEKALIEQVEQMKISTKINALNILITYYTNQINNQNNTEEIILKAREKRREAIREIDSLLNRMKDDLAE